MALPDARDEAFAEFFAATWPRLYRSALSRCGDPEVAEAALQQTFARVHASWRRVIGSDRPEALVEEMVADELERGGHRRTEAPVVGNDDVPPGDVLRAVREGEARKRRARRRAGAVVAVVLVVAGAVGTGVLVGGNGPAPASGGPQVQSFPDLGPFDATGGLRVFTAPGDPVNVGGRGLEADAVPDLDTATATRDGIVFSAEGRPYLLGIDGVSRALITDPVDADFVPTARSQVDGRLAFTTMSDGQVTLWARDTATATDGPRTLVPCGNVCDSVVLDGFDRDIVFGHDDDGAFAWNSALHLLVSLGTGTFRLADARNGTVLFTGEAPSGTGAIPGFTFVRTSTPDDRLTFDGRYVLGRTSVLEPVAGVGRTGRRPPIRLHLPGGRPPSPGFYAIDTDGSVLAAVGGDQPRFTVYDCAVPSGSCEAIGHLDQGYPTFPGSAG